MRSQRFSRALRTQWQSIFLSLVRTRHARAWHGSVMGIITFFILAGLLGSFLPTNFRFALGRAVVPAVSARDISAAQIAVVSAASYETTVAPDSIASIFGSGLATQIAVGNDTDPNTPGTQLPTELAGTTVEVNGKRTALFFVSSGQINLVLPADVAIGTANVVVRAGNGTTNSGTAQIVLSDPALFTLNGAGSGVPAANILRFKTNGTQVYEDIFQWDDISKRFIPRSVDLGPSGEKVFLILYGTALRYAERTAIRVLIGSEEKTPLAAGANPSFVGVDQVNVEIPRTLIGRGIVNVSVAALGFGTSNLVDISIAGNSGTTPPQINTFGVTEVLAGSQLTIMGAGFATSNPEDNIVKIAGGAPAKVMEATTSQLKVVVPFGSETGQVSVTTPQGTGNSPNPLRVRTSISGIVENTNRQPLSNVAVRIERTLATDPLIETRTSDQGAFVLPDVPVGIHNIIIDGSSIPVSPPYPTPIRRQEAKAHRDNPFTSIISLQQSSGSSGTIGGSSFGEQNYSSGFRVLSLTPDSLIQSITQSLLQELPEQNTGVTLQSGNLSLAFPNNISALFPNGETRGTIYLTPIPKGRTPVALPDRVYSESIAQITPFGVKLSPGAKLTFANTENYQVGAKLALYRYDYTKGLFEVMEGATLTVSPDRQRIETGATDIKDASIYFVGLAERKPTTTVYGRVLCCELPDGTVNDPKPIARATVRVRGQMATTDGNGGFVVRNVAASTGEIVRVDVSYLRADGRTDVAESKEVQTAASGLTNAGAIYLPADTANRAPVILAATRVQIDAGKATDVSLAIYDPDLGDNVNALLGSGPSWATLCRSCRSITTGAQPVVNSYVLQLRPPASARGESLITIVANDFEPGRSSDKIATTTFMMTVVVNNPNRPPTADEQEVITDEDRAASIKLTASDPDAGAKLSYELVRQPSAGTLSGVLPNVTYTPRLNFNGSDSFSFRVNDGQDYSLPATVKVTVRPVNDAPILTVPAATTIAEGQPLTLNLSAADVDTGQTLTFSSSALPAGATLNSTSPTTAQVRWTPNFTQAGAYTINFQVTDNGMPAMSDSKDARIIVTKQPASLSVPAAQSGIEGQPLVFDVATSLSVLDATITTSALPTGATFTARGGGVWQFRWTPGTDQSGVYTISFRLNAAGVLIETRDVRLTIADVFRDFNKESADLTILGAHGPLPLSSTDVGDAIGTSVATGDINGDGVSDLIVGAPNANSDLPDAGKVYVFFGKAALAGTIDLAQQRPDLIILGEKAYDGFGTSLAVGDVTGDAQADLLIGASLADQLERKDSGKLYVIQGPLKTELENQLVNRLASFTVWGAKSGDHLGASVAVGAFNEKTGALDFVIGAPGYDPKEGNDAGAVFGFWGGDKLGGVLDLAQGTQSFALTGVVAGGQAGKTLAVGNFNGDDISDIAIGAPSINVGATRANGTVYLVQSALTLKSVKTLAEEVPFPLAGDREGDLLSTSLAFGDYDGDGLADLAIGIPGADGADGLRRNSGKVTILFGARLGSTATRALTVYGPGSKDDLVSDEFGTSVTMGDFNGDGLADLLVGTPGYDTTTEKREPLGAAFLLWGARTNSSATIDLSTRAADLTVIGVDPGDRLGSGALAIGNVNGGTGTNAIQDLIFGLPYAYSLNNARGEAGEIRIIFGLPR